jgi:hypothetical protein
MVKLTIAECSCGEYNTILLSCLHVIAAYDKYELNRYKYCSLFYSSDIYQWTYQESVYPVPNISQWDTPEDVIPICDKIYPPNLFIYIYIHTYIYIYINLLKDGRT